MLTVSSLIDFLLSLLRDEQAQAEFEKDPQGMLARHGLDGVCAQDVREARPMLADHEDVHVDSGADQVSYAAQSTPSHDVVHEIDYVRQNYHAEKNVQNNVQVNAEHNEYNFSYVDNSITIDDRDTTTIVAENGDVDINDSFNDDNDVTVIDDSFNQDNDGVDNKGGQIDDSVVAGRDVDDSLNSDDDTSVSDSGNSDDDTAVSDDDTSTVIRDSSNQDNDTDSSQDNDTEVTTEDNDTQLEVTDSGNATSTTTSTALDLDASIDSGDEPEEMHEPADDGAMEPAGA